VYNNRKPPEEPPCWKCKVDLLEENWEAAEIFTLCRGQVVTAGMGDVIDINLVPVMMVIDRKGTHNPLSCVIKVQTLFQEFLKRSRKK
jgi:hypothetical protein